MIIIWQRKIIWVTTWALEPWIILEKHSGKDLVIVWLLNTGISRNFVVWCSLDYCVHNDIQKKYGFHIDKIYQKFHGAEFCVFVHWWYSESTYFSEKLVKLLVEFIYQLIVCQQIEAISLKDIRIQWTEIKLLHHNLNRLLENLLVGIIYALYYI